MIGNDIVDLQEATRNSRCRENRYWRKILTASEERAFLDPVPDLALLWAIWAVKESAYKLERRLGRSRAFCPKDYRVTPVPGGDVGLVSGLYDSYPFHLLRTGAFVHARCHLQGIEIPDFEVRSIAAPTPFPDSHWTIRKLTNGALLAVQLNTGVQFAVSKSHHGRFQAFAWTVAAHSHVTSPAD